MTAYREFAEKKAIDIGSFYADSSKFARATGWSPEVGLRDGLARTIVFYRQYFDRYVDAPPPAPASGQAASA